MPKAKRRLIVNADDFGLCTGTVTGILHGYRHGIITSTSLMLTVPKSGSAVQAARSHPNLDVGVHLTFTEGRPVLAAEWVPSLVNERGIFLSPDEWLTSGRQPVMAELRAEWRAQMFLAFQAGLRISHLDIHTSVGYLMPEVFELVVSLAVRYKLAIRFPFSEGWEQIGMAAVTKAGLSREQVEAVVARYRQTVAVAEVPHPDRFINAFPTLESCQGEALAQLINNLDEGTTELLTHPASLYGCRRYLGAAADKRVAELAALCDPRVKEAIADAGIELVSFRALL